MPLSVGAAGDLAKRTYVFLVDVVLQVLAVTRPLHEVGPTGGHRRVSGFVRDRAAFEPEVGIDRDEGGIDESTDGQRRGLVEERR